MHVPWLTFQAPLLISPRSSSSGHSLLVDIEVESEATSFFFDVVIGVFSFLSESVWAN